MEGPGNVAVERRALAQAVYAPDWWAGSGLERNDFTGARRPIYDAVELVMARDVKHASWPNVRLEIDRVFAGSGVQSYGMVVEELGAVIESRGRPTELEVNHLRELSVCRSVGKLSRDLAGAIDGGDIRRVRELIEVVSDVAEGGHVEPSRSAYELGLRAYQRLTDPVSQDGWAHLGLSHLDHQLGKMAPGMLLTIGARPNVGKSGIVLSMSEGAIPYGTTPGYISLEDNEDIVGPRVLALKSGVSARSMMRKRVGPFHMPSLRSGLEKLQDFPFYTEFVLSGQHALVRHAMRKLSRKGVNLAFIDYLQVLRMRSQGNRRIDRREEIGTIITELKNEGKKRGQALVLLSQLRRQLPKKFRAKNDDANRPTMDELKEAGDIEEKSDQVLLLWRNDNADDAPVWCEVAKSKWGGVGYTFKLRRGEDGILREMEPHAAESERMF